MAPPRVLLKPAEPEAPPKSTAPPPQSESADIKPKWLPVMFTDANVMLAPLA